MKCVRASLAALFVGILIAGCLGPADQPTLQVALTPAFGNVPYSATIHAFAPPGEFTFELADTTIVQEDGKLDVIVDRMNWTVVVTWTDGKTTLTQQVEAGATNPRPVIERPVINGDKYLWQLEPLERTLISFNNSVRYSGEWRVVSIEVTADPLGEFTVFHPPYEAGVYHAEYYNVVHDNACIIYPDYLSIETSGLPYSVTALDTGYPYAGIRNTNAYFVDFPSSTEGGEEVAGQQVTIKVKVLDEWNRTTSATFMIRVNPLDYTDDPVNDDDEDED